VAKYLILNDPNVRWQLPDKTDVARVVAALKGSSLDAVVDVDVILAGQVTTLSLRRDRLMAFAVVDVASSPTQP
jgi:hypothetical protein